MIQFNRSVECVTKENVYDLSNHGKITFIEHNSNENPCNNWEKKGNKKKRTLREKNLLLFI